MAVEIWRTWGKLATTLVWDAACFRKVDGGKKQKREKLEWFGFRRRFHTWVIHVLHNGMRKGCEIFARFVETWVSLGRNRGCAQAENAQWDGFGKFFYDLAPVSQVSEARHGAPWFHSRTRSAPNHFSGGIFSSLATVPSWSISAAWLRVRDAGEGL